ncbi:glycosyltransferase [Aggregatibacter actinomycetemcomitans]|uniref:rhamnosyltransferase WsaF family glycosyltransferase n=1 Tax=Aggregatibacter actinomycetemcomitans TaxID=714 RepID=UPI0002400208|nr:glycosyltransferase [Aggregatibacter actinomycetemcomitans]EHK89644.1 group 1 glycosyl transferase [Aggregatibacter actinomycetemcomitans RhAA1]KNE76745.1 glycosyl transferase [Aggregatibacter actinomycetemcomitans RhAA1]
MNKIKKAFSILNEHGLFRGSLIILRKILKKSPDNIILGKTDILKFYNFINYSANPPKLKQSINISSPKIIWFIPDFGIGSGGHLNIFRMIYNLEKLDIHSDIAVCGSSQWGTEKVIKDILSKHFFPLNSRIFILENDSGFEQLISYDIAMATSWQTAYYVNKFNNCYKKAYFVQDYEPYFTALGSVYFFAEETYKFGFFGITAGNWLSEKLEKKYSMPCKPFSFSYDRELYAPHKRNEPNKKHIFFYARPPTERRAFELGLLVLDKVTKKRPDISIIFAGWDVSSYEIPFHHLNAGVVKLDELSHLYSQCDAALVLSFTNLSLLPLELLASGCPVVMNKGNNNDWIDIDKKLFIYSNNIDELANTLIDVVDKKINVDFNYVNQFLSSTSWENEARKVKSIIHSILNEETDDNRKWNAC